MQAKVRVASCGGQRRMSSASLLGACVFLVVACGHDASRTVLVQADTTAVSWGSSESGSARGLSVERLAVPDSADVMASSEGATAERATSVSPARRESRRARPTRTPPEDADPRTRPADPDELRERDGRPPPPVLLPAGRILLPPGTVLVAELRTPIHTATTLVGDRFAAQLTQDVAAGGRVVIPAGALVEGRVSHVGSASEAGRIAFIELDARKVRLAHGRRLRIHADVLDVTGEEVLAASGDGRGAAVLTSAIDGAELSEAALAARKAILASILEGVNGRAIVARSTDREIIVPIGTPFTLELMEPLEIPAP